jgi:pimeloyl-ACP methyl ester carboxylesterase
MLLDIVQFVGMSLLAATAVTLVAGVASASQPPRLVESCVRKSDPAHPVAFRTTDGKRIVGALFGKGRVGVVAGHQYGGTLCNWVPFARVLAARGIRVLTIDFRGYASSAGAGTSTFHYDRDLLGGATFLRRAGVRKVFFAGESMGGTAALVAASKAGAPAGVISLSGPASFGSLDAEKAIRKLTAPTFLAVGARDVDFVVDAHTLYDASHAPDKRLDVVARTGAHGTALLTGPFRQRVIAFLTSHR